MSNGECVTYPSWLGMQRSGVAQFTFGPDLHMGPLGVNDVGGRSAVSIVAKMAALLVVSSF